MNVKSAQSVFYFYKVPHASIIEPNLKFNSQNI